MRFEKAYIFKCLLKKPIFQMRFEKAYIFKCVYF